MYVLSNIAHGGWHQSYHFLDIEEKGERNCCQNSVSPYAEYYIIKSLYDAQNDDTNKFQHDLTARFLISQKFRQGHMKNVYLQYAKNYARALYWNIWEKIDEYRDGKMLSYVPLCNFSTMENRIMSYINKMPNTAMQKLITDQDVRELSKIASTFRDKVREGRYLLPPYGLSLRCDFAYECNKQAYRRLMEVDEKLKKQKKKLKRFYKYHKSHIDTPEYVEINKSLKALRQEWQEECVTFMNNLKTDEVTVTAHSFIPGAVEELHMNGGRVVGDVKKRYEDSQYQEASVVISIIDENN